MGKTLKETTEETENEIVMNENSIEQELKNKTDLSEILAEQEEYMNEYVTVRLFRDSNKYKDDVFVAVNGECCLIKRGYPVEIKRKFAMTLDNSAAQDENSAIYTEKLQREFSDDKEIFDS